MLTPRQNPQNRVIHRRIREVGLKATEGPRLYLPAEALVDVLDITLTAAIELSQLRVLERLAKFALHRAERMRVSCAGPASVLGRILYGRGSVQEAAQRVMPRLPRIREASGLDFVSDAYRVVASASAREGDFASAFARLDEASDLAGARNWPRLLAAMLAERVRLCEPGGEGRVALRIDRLQNLVERNRPHARCALRNWLSYQSPIIARQ
jgi:ATP/maltotriose-dependent transcriptional regulator MalT